MLWLQIKNEKFRNIVICNLYRPPKGNLDKFIQFLEKGLGDINTKKNDVFLVGDWNADYKNINTPAYKKVSFFEKSNQLTQTVKNTTRNSNKTKTLIDLIMTNSPHIHSSGTIENFISDHQMTYVIRKKIREKFQSRTFKGRSYKALNTETLLDNLASTDWKPFFQINDMNLLWDTLEKQITAQLDLQCPIRNFRIKNYRPEWMSPGLIDQINDRDYFYRKAKVTGDSDDWAIAKHLRNTTNRNIRQAKADFVINQLETNKNDNAKFWKNIKELFPSKKSGDKPHISLVDDKGIIPDERTPDYINDFFINVGNQNSHSTTISVHVIGNDDPSLLGQ